MDTKQFCQNCQQEHDCQKVYEQLAKVKGPSMAPKAFIAFLLPLIVFVACLIFFQEVLEQRFENKNVLTIICFGLAAGVTCAVILLIKLVSSRLTGKVCCED